MTDTKTFVLRSVDRLSSSSSSSNCSFYFKNGISLEGAQEIELAYFLAYNTVYNISTGYNDRLDFTDTQARAGIITQGFYGSGSALATALQTAMNAVSSGYTVSYDTVSKKLTFSNAANFTLNTSTGPNASKSCWREIGLLNSSGTAAIDSSTGTSYTAPYCVNLTTPLNFLIQIKELPFACRDSNGNEGTFAIPVSVVSSGAIEYKAGDYWAQKIPVDPRKSLKLSNLSVRFVREADSQDLPLNGSEWHLILKVS